VSFEGLCNAIGTELATKLRDISLALYEKASKYAESRGIILAFEFGILDGKIVLGDELFTPDSSRFWDMNEYEPGRAQKSFDKQFVREYLESIGWDKKPPAPTLPDDVVKNTELKYIEAKHSPFTCGECWVYILNFLCGVNKFEKAWKKHFNLLVMMQGQLLIKNLF